MGQIESESPSRLRASELKREEPIRQNQLFLPCFNGDLKRDRADQAESTVSACFNGCSTKERANRAELVSSQSTVSAWFNGELDREPIIQNQLFLPVSMKGAEPEFSLVNDRLLIATISAAIYVKRG